MGKRKERRLAALSNGGRRVKLDLSVEPTECMNGFMDKEEDRRDLDLKPSTGSPDSPSSSGQLPDDSLVLLGQYTDDELDENSKSGTDKAGNMDNLLDDKDSKVEDQLYAKKSDLNPIESTGGSTDDGFEKEVENGPTEEKVCRVSEECNVIGSWLSDYPITQDPFLGWRAVMDEGSKRVYYWNMGTGETSWEIPEILMQGSKPMFDMSDFPSIQGKETIIPNGPPRLDSSIEADSSAALGAFLVSNPIRGKEAEEFYLLIENAERLLQKLKSIKGCSGPDPDSVCSIERWMTEVEVRLGDAKALIPYGTSLLPFWKHTEEQLKKLEGIIISGEVYRVRAEEANSADVKESNKEDDIRMKSGEEDISMEVDMEVEEISDAGAPPPPEEEWVPPPPPPLQPLPDESETASCPFTCSHYLEPQQYNHNLSYLNQQNMGFYANPVGDGPSIYSCTEENIGVSPALQLPPLYYTVTAATEIAPLSPTIHAPSTSTKPSAASASTVSAPSSSSSTKAPVKIGGNKKQKVSVVSSMRSNKKVSSMVDKWKAAKEELHEGEEDDDDDDYETLQKKRQKEIQEWLAQKKGSGQCKENANFQPLGGDWREKIMRRRESSVEGSLHSSETSLDLPHGWKVHWDEASKQVYYANSLTSETKWTRPFR